MRTAKLVAAGAVGLLALTACGGVGGGGESDTGEDDANVLEVGGFGLGDEIATTRVDRYKAGHGDVELKVNEGSFDAQQFLSAVASGNPPDVVYMTREVLGTYAAAGALLPLQDCIASGIDMAQYREQAVNQVTLAGQVYGIPEFYSTRVLLVNTQAADEAGIDPASITTADWGAFAGLSTTLTTREEDGSLNRVGVNPKLPEFLPLWAKANGAELVNPDGSPKLDDPKVVEALEYAAGIVNAEGGWADVKAFMDGWDFFGEENQFATNQLGVQPMEDWYLNVLAEASPDAPVAVKPFEDRDGNPITFASGNAWAIPKGSSDPEAACEFVKTMTEVDAWVEAAKARAAARTEEGLPFTGLYTGNRVADDRIFAEVYKPSGTSWLDEGVQVLRSNQDVAFSSPNSPAASEIKDAWTEAANSVLSGEKTAQEALAAAQADAQEAYDSAGK